MTLRDISIHENPSRFKAGSVPRTKGAKRPKVSGPLAAHNGTMIFEGAAPLHQNEMPPSGPPPE
jgi:hypothetical protein